MSVALRFTNGGEPTPDERRDIAAAYGRWTDATGGDSNDEELDAARDLIERLMSFASIEADEDDARECARCGEEVGYLSTRDWCDGCEALPLCDECEEEATSFWPNLLQPVQLCAGCEHNARRSGWEPGQ
ncbi:hypothetical protein [Microbacterium sp. ZOR0019]|uniref:hypothetical protein n=1 Tax=Microbacterium sp. ZOR0019 TaxID=1339233 RepID=UPI00064731B5|nr:hypothetical protein [Microbacterium sp. ZOR0019]